MDRALCRLAVVILLTISSQSAQTNEKASQRGSIDDIKAGSLKADIAMNFTSGWFNDQNAKTPQDLRDYDSLKPSQLVTSSVVLHKVELIGGTTAAVEKIVVVTQGSKPKFELTPYCSWTVYYEGNSVKLASDGCIYPQGARGYFDITTMYQEGNR